MCVCVCGARAGTERFRPRREQPGSKGTRGSVLMACAAHRRGMHRPRARGSETRAISWIPLFMARTCRPSQRARRRCTSSIYGRIEEFADAGWCISYEQGDLQPSLLIECRRVVPSVSMTVALEQLAKTSWRSQHVVYGRTGDPKIGVIATGLRQVSQPKLDLRLNTTPQSISMDRCR